MRDPVCALTFWTAVIGTTTSCAQQGGSFFATTMAYVFYFNFTDFWHLKEGKGEKKDFEKNSVSQIQISGKKKTIIHSFIYLTTDITNISKIYFVGAIIASFLGTDILYIYNNDYDELM